MKKLNEKYFVLKDLRQIAVVSEMITLVRWYNLVGKCYADLWNHAVRRFADRSFMEFEGEVWTFRDMEKYSNRFARFLKSRGIGKGDVIAIMMENCPNFVGMWLGAAKVGAVAALINYNLRGAQLVHSILVAKCKLVFVGRRCMPNLASARADLLASASPPHEYFVLGASQRDLQWGQSLDDILLGDALQEKPKFRSGPTPAEWRAGVTMDSPLLLVYTSGTTGLPKAATIKHSRVYVSGKTFSAFFHIRPDDRVYSTLPLYHSACGVASVGMAIETGCTLLIKRKFSQSTFWADCVAERATAIQYIGELCRYLLQGAPSPYDQAHKVRLAFGNGLRPDIWVEFQKRFNIPEIGEFYGSTEGNAVMFNFCDRDEAVGAVGHMGPICHMAAGMHLVPYDVNKDEVIRESNGFCRECKPGEVGELLAKIFPGDPVRTFSGYYGNEAGTKSKIMTDVFSKGDAYFRTGDLLRRDEKGYWYFVDRIGDTFRWKGENVSTAEVEAAIAKFPGITEVTAYGAAIPGTDGRACMVAITLDHSISQESFSWNEFAKFVTTHLPGYMVPIFVRILPKLELTSTFKHQKTELRNQGANPVGHPAAKSLFVLSADRGTYEPLTEVAWEKLLQRMRMGEKQLKPSQL